MTNVVPFGRRDRGMQWFVDDDGSLMVRLRQQLSPFGPLQSRQGADVVQDIMSDLHVHGVEIETDSLLTRVREAAGVSETVWTGRVLQKSQIADAREYFQRLAKSFMGS